MRVTLYLLVPMCVVYTLFLIANGVPQTFTTSVDATTIEGARQTILLGPVASQEAIKMFGTNGGGIFNANSAHPFENPNAFTNLVQMLSIFAIGVGLCWTFGKAVGNTRQGWAILSAMMVLFLAGTLVAYSQEAAGNPIHHALGIAGGNMEGKEVRFGIAASSLFAGRDHRCVVRRGQRDARQLHRARRVDPDVHIQLGEVIVGGVGAGIYGFLLFAILAVFVAGLMVGRTPEYVGKKIEGREVKLAVLAIAVLPLMILGIHGDRRGAAAGPGGPAQQGAARLFRDPLRLLVGDREQRFGLRRPHRGHALLQRAARRRDVGGALLHDYPGARDRGQPGGEEAPSRIRRLLPDDWGAVDRPAGGDHPDRRRPHLPSRARARPDRRSSRDDRRPALLTGVTDMTIATMFSTKLIGPAIGDAFRKLNPRPAGEDPVLFTTAVVALLLTGLLFTGGEKLSLAFQVQLIFWLWLTVLFGTFAEVRGGARARAGRHRCAQPNRS